MIRIRFRNNGTVVARQIRFHVSRTLTGNLVYLAEADTDLLVFDDQGALIIEQPVAGASERSMSAAARSADEDPG